MYFTSATQAASKVTFIQRRFADLLQVLGTVGMRVHPTRPMLCPGTLESLGVGRGGQLTHIITPTGFKLPLKQVP